MKKTIVFFVFLIIALNLKAQITLEHSFSSQGHYTWYYNSDEGIRYYGFNKATNQLTLYNVDYSIYKTITMSIAADYKFYSIYCVSDKLFNSDDKIEFVFVTSKGTDYSMKLYDENKNLLKDFGNRFFASVISRNEVCKLFVRLMIYNSTTQIYSYLDEVYSLPGKIPNFESTIELSNNLSAYPNPSNSFINLPYVLDNDNSTIMHIYNLNGQLIEQKHIDSNFKAILLNVQSYPSGTYIYEYNGISKKFVVE